jgi:hypothetical protein
MCSEYKVRIAASLRIYLKQEEMKKVKRKGIHKQNWLRVEVESLLLELKEAHRKRNRHTSDDTRGQQRLKRRRYDTYLQGHETRRREHYREWLAMQNVLDSMREADLRTDKPTFPHMISVLFMADIHSLRSLILLIRMQPRDQVVLEVMITMYVVTMVMSTRATIPRDLNVPIGHTLEQWITKWEGFLVILAMTCHPIVCSIPVRNMIHQMILPHLQMKKTVTEHIVDHVGTNKVIEQMTVIVVKDDKHKITDGTIYLILLTYVVRVDVVDNHKDHPIDQEEIKDQMIPKHVQPEHATTAHIILRSPRIMVGMTMIYVRACMKPKFCPVTNGSFATV